MGKGGVFLKNLLFEQVEDNEIPVKNEDVGSERHIYTDNNYEMPEMSSITKESVEALIYEKLMEGNFKHFHSSEQALKSSMENDFERYKLYLQR